MDIEKVNSSEEHIFRKIHTIRSQQVILGVMGFIRTISIRKVIAGLISIGFIFAGCNIFAANTVKNEIVQQKPIIADYFAIFDFNSVNDPGWQYRLGTAPFDQLNRLYISFAWIKNGVIVYQNPDKVDANKIDQLVAKCKSENPKATRFIVTGFDNGDMYKEAAKDPDKYADSVVKFLQDHDLNGYDMDWENGIDSNDMLALLKALHTKFQSHGYLLTVAVWQYPSYGSYNLKEMAKYVNEINIMSYGTGLTLKECAQAYIKDGFPADKIIGGLDTEIDYNGWGGGVDSLGPEGSIKTKCNYALQNGLAGMMAWRLDNDYRPMKDGKAYGEPTYKGAMAMYQDMQ